MRDRRREFELLAEAYEQSGGQLEALKDARIASLVVSLNKILGKNEISGLTIEGEETTTGVRAQITVAQGTVIEHPVHLCFGVLPKEGVQEIVAEFVMEDRAKATFLAHCSFPNAERVRHIMQGTVQVGKGASMTYNETHYHGTQGGVVVLPLMRVNVKERGEFRSEFRLAQGAVGQLHIDYEVRLADYGLCELYAKVYGKGDDRIRVKESIYLDGAHARGLARSRIVVADRAESEVVGEIVGNAPFSRGHVDCVEIIQSTGARASAVPMLRVADETAKLTHEAAIGSVDKKQVETLMARGLTESEAVEVVVQGLLR
ncbi:MAG: SufD family Fe-S cluster assembly protein [candidate division KSB1 bacterium]|nr:SufD family Fe-S cluster assembly protein [candidate division KSB1 bacterium]